MEAVALLKLHILEAVLAEPELGLFSIVFREWGEVPGIDLIVPNVDFVYIFHLGDLGDKVGKKGRKSLVEQGIRKQRSTGKTPTPAHRLMLLLQGRRGGVHLSIGLCRKESTE